MASARRRLLPSEHDLVRVKEAHNNTDQALQDAEADIDELQEELADLDAAAEAITDASVAHALNAVFSDTEVETALNALGTKINAILAALRDLA